MRANSCSNHQVGFKSKKKDDDQQNKKSKPSTDDTIKVVVRFKGGEALEDREAEKWRISSIGNEITTPEDPGGF